MNDGNTYTTIYVLSALAEDDEGMLECIARQNIAIRGDFNHMDKAEGYAFWMRQNPSVDCVLIDRIMYIGDNEA